MPRRSSSVRRKSGLDEVKTQSDFTESADEVEERAVKACSRSSRIRSPSTPEAQENLAISLAMDLAIKKLKDGTAPSQLITEFVKRGAAKASLELELLKNQTELAAAKADAIKSAAHTDELYKEAMKAMKRYACGRSDDEDDEDEDY